MFTPDIDTKLSTPNRSLKAYPGKLLFSPTGERLFVDYLDKKPGFCGRIDFIHKINITQLFEVTCSTNPDFAAAQTMWYPSRLTLDYEDEDVCLHETKMITKNDIAFSVQTWKNKSEDAITLQLVVRPELLEVEKGNGFCNSWFELKQHSHNCLIGVGVNWNAGKTDTLQVQPGEEITFVAAAATGNMNTQTREEVQGNLQTFFAQELTPTEYIEKYAKEYQSFFDKLPIFESSDEVLNHTWFYRWYILRHCTSKPNFGYLKHTTVYEGRGHKTGKAPLKVSGWEFSRLICLSSPLQMTDYKWYPDKEMLHDIIRGYFDTEDENGICQSAFVDHYGSPFCNFMVWAVYQVYLLDGDKEFVKEMLPKLKKCVDGNTKVYGAKNDYLQIEVKHQRTGKEFQPSYWYFNEEYPQNPKDKSTIMPLKLLDTSMYHYLNIKGLSEMMAAVGDEQAEEYKKMADTLASQINTKMWDEETGFYYDLHHETDEKAMVKNIVGAYPYWAGIADDDKLRGMDYLFDTEHFARGCVFATVSKECPMYAPSGGWKGVHKGRNSCVWNGPSWPYTNGIILDGIGKQSQLHDHKYDKQFAEFLREYSLQHYQEKDITKPYLVEQYHAETGEPLSDEPDYNHSYYLELIMGYVAGLHVNEHQFTVDPCDVGLSWFKLEHVKVRGKEISIGYSKGKARPAKGLEKGLVIKVDGKIVHHSEEIEKVTIEL